MTDAPIHCARGCRRRDHHLPHCETPDACPGCEPRLADHGTICHPCTRKLDRLLGEPSDHESIAGACAWLATNLGQHIRTPSGGTRGSAEAGEHFVIVATAMSALQVALVEFARDFAENRTMTLRCGTNPASVAAWLRPWTATLAAWEPIADTLDHLLDLMCEAHAAAPWRGRDPGASDEAAAMLYLAPAETTDAICDRFGIKAARLWKWKQRGRVLPDRPDEKPLKWRPWEVFTELHPEAAKRHEEKLQQLQVA